MELVLYLYSRTLVSWYLLSAGRFRPTFFHWIVEHEPWMEPHGSDESGIYPWIKKLIGLVVWNMVFLFPKWLLYFPQPDWDDDPI